MIIFLIGHSDDAELKKSCDTQIRIRKWKKFKFVLIIICTPFILLMLCWTVVGKVSLLLKIIYTYSEEDADNVNCSGM